MAQLQQAMYAQQQQQQLYNAHLQQQQSQLSHLMRSQSQSSSSQSQSQNHFRPPSVSASAKITKKLHRKKSNKKATKSNTTKTTTKHPRLASLPKQQRNTNRDLDARPLQPPVLPPKVKTELERCLSWIIYNDQIDDFAAMLCDSLELKVFVINQCARHSSSHASCIRWSKKWALVGHADCAESVRYAMTCAPFNSQRAKFARSFPDEIPL